MKFYIIVFLLFCAGNLAAQNNIESILRSIEKNNKELQAKTGSSNRKHSARPECIIRTEMGKTGLDRKNRRVVGIAEF